MQRELRELPGCTVLIYDQTCAAEKRRRRKRGKYPDPAKRVVINELVCEGCGDCGVKSNCVSVAPVETEFGRKRTIDQSSCNKDFSCVKGFCPSFVTVEGGCCASPRRPMPPIFRACRRPCRWRPGGTLRHLVTGIGGTGVVTIGALLGMAAHLEGKGVSVLDMTGLAQKNGAVVSHVRIADHAGELHATRIAAGEAKLVLACDILTGVGDEALAKMQRGVTQGAGQHRAGDARRFHARRRPHFRWADGAGDSRRGRRPATRIPRRHQARHRAHGRLHRDQPVHGRLRLSARPDPAVGGVDPARDRAERRRRRGQQAELPLGPPRRGRCRSTSSPPPSGGQARLAAAVDPLDEIIARRAAFLTGYQDAAYAARYTDLVAKVRAAEAQQLPEQTALTEAVARYYFKLLAIKDEYEVARLYTEANSLQRVAAQFEGDYKLASISRRRSPTTRSATGEPQKSSYGPWMMRAFRVLAKLKGLRGTRSTCSAEAERKAERQLIADYEALIDEITAAARRAQPRARRRLASIPEHIRGYGHVKERHLRAAKAKEAELLAAFRAAKLAAAPIERVARSRRARIRSAPVARPRPARRRGRSDRVRAAGEPSAWISPSISPAKSRSSLARIAASASPSPRDSRTRARRSSSTAATGKARRGGRSSPRRDSPRRPRIRRHRPRGITRAVDAIEREHGSLDILFNNAGIQRRHPLVEFPQEDWDEVIATNLTAPFLVSQAALPGMIARRSGKIIHIASLMSELARPTVVPYTAAKGGVRQLTRGMAVELAPHNIQVNAIAPGYFATEMNRALIDNAEFNAWV